MMKKMMISLALIVATGVAMTGCDKSLDKKYDPETVFEDLEVIVDRDKATPEEVGALSVYLIAAKIEGKDLTGKTYRELFKEAMSAKKEAESLQQNN